MKCMVSDGEDRQWWAIIWVELIGGSKTEVEMSKIERADRKLKEDNKSDQDIIKLKRMEYERRRKKLIIKNIMKRYNLTAKTIKRYITHYVYSEIAYNCQFFLLSHNYACTGGDEIWRRGVK